MEKSDARKLIWIGIFAVSMAFVETTVVYYLRKLYYPNNVLFPLNVSMPSQILVIEWVREACTIIMLLSIAVLAGKKFQEKFAYFIYSFAIWDIFYYIWLKVLLDWPTSLLTWDVLFLIPLTWVSPVLAPVLVSITMLIFAFMILQKPNKKVNMKEWALLMFASALVYISFIWDYTNLLLKKGLFEKFSKLTLDPEIIKAAAEFIPQYYHWELFIIGEFLALTAIFLWWRRGKK